MIEIKIGIISDTHISKDTYKIEELLNKYFKDIDLIIHAGDFKCTKVIDIIKKEKKFIGVWGNNDGESVRKQIKEKEIIRLCSYKIGIYHGHGETRTTLDRTLDLFKDDKVDIVILGHSHQPVIKTVNKTLVLNPGSPTSKHKERWFSFIILELEKDCINAYIKFFNKI